MNELKIETGKHNRTISVPSCWNELSQNEFISVARFLAEKDSNPLAEKRLLAVLLRCSLDSVSSFPTMKLYFLFKEAFGFLLAPQAIISKLLIPSIELEGQTLIGYQPSFSNTTWEEFVYADGYSLAGRFREAAAVLYRPQRHDFNGETDRRIPFTIYGTDSRMELFSKMDDTLLLAISINYNALRRNFLENRYPSVFARKGKKKKTKGQGETAFSWVGIHRDLMGDHFYDEHKFFESNVHSILNRLENVIESNRLHRK